MVDVQIGIPRETRVNEIDQALERLALALAVVRPERLVAGFIAVQPEDPEEVFQPSRGLEEGVALEVEDEIAA